MMLLCGSPNRSRARLVTDAPRKIQVSVGGGETEAERKFYPRAVDWPLRSVLALPPLVWCCACGVHAAPPLALPCTRSGLSLRPGHSAGAPEGSSSSTGHGSPLSSQTRRPSPSRLSLEHTARSQDATTLAIEVVSQSVVSHNLGRVTLCSSAARAARFRV